MINDEFNKNYKKLCFYVEEIITDELSRNIRNRLNNISSRLEYEISYHKMHAKDPSSFFWNGTYCE